MKTNITVTVDVNAITEARKRKLPISFIVNNFLKSYLEIKENKTKGKDINTAIAEAKTKVIELEKQREKAEKAEKKKYGVKFDFSD